MKDHFVIPVAEVYVVECDISLELLISRAVVRLLVIMFPRPMAGVLVCLNDRSVFIIFAVDQHDVSLVGLRLFVQKLEDTFRTRKSHDDTVELHTYLVDGHTETLIETCKAPDSKARVRIEGEKRSHQCDDHVIRVAHLRVDGPDDIRKGICLVGALVKFFIEFIEGLNGLLFVTEYFDNFLPCHGLLDKTVQLTDILLLRDEIFP